MLMLMITLKAQIFVAVDGDDTNPGTSGSPLATISAAVSLAKAGDTIFVHGGTYNLKNTIYLRNSGSDSLGFYLFNYPDERPVLDFSEQEFGNKGIRVYADYWHIKGFDVTAAGDNGLQISGGSYNIVERCNFYENRDSGVQMDDGAAYNQCINCDSYYNADPWDYGDADGFAAKLDVGTGNSYYGCRAWGNCDDGWDGYLRGANDVSTTIENCWTWGNGYFKDGTDPGSQANGNGFKMGGGDNSNSGHLMHHHRLVNCLAFNNKAKGFDQNNNMGSMTLLNCTGYNNGSANFRIKRELVSGQTLVVKNCLSYNGSVELGNFAEQLTNSWLSPFEVSEDDFITLKDSMASAPRQADGSLPDIDFLHLAEGSDLIDGGTDIGLAYLGSAPDLGAFESEYATSIVKEHIVAEDFHLKQNYPNPFNPTTTINYTIPRTTDISLKIYDISGGEVATLFDGSHTTGNYRVNFDGSGLSSGVYFCRLQSDADTKTIKMMLLK